MDEMRNLEHLFETSEPKIHASTLTNVAETKDETKGLSHDCNDGAPSVCFRQGASDDLPPL